MNGNHLQEENQVAVLRLAHDLELQVLEDGDAHVHLVVFAEKHADADVVADLRPVQVVPETLANPVLTDLNAARI